MKPLTDHPAWQPIPARLDVPATGHSLSWRRLRRWGLVLEARQIPFRSARQGFGWQLLVPADRYAEALRELQLYEEENHNWPPPPLPSDPLVDNQLAALTVLLALATFHNLTQLDIRLLGHHPVDWLGLGNAHAGRVLAGEWWRLFTALTLHADWLHLWGNLVFGGVFVVRLCRELGAGLAWGLTLAVGGGGNLLNALLQAPGHQAVGASTAVFGCVGLFATLSLVRYRRLLWRRWALPLAAALALLALLGSSGARTDLGAHLFGFGCGLAAGLPSGWLLNRRGRPGPALNRLLAALSAALVGCAWLAALT